MGKHIHAQSIHWKTGQTPAGILATLWISCFNTWAPFVWFCFVFWTSETKRQLRSKKRKEGNQIRSYRFGSSNRESSWKRQAFFCCVSGTLSWYKMASRFGWEAQLPPVARCDGALQTKLFFSFFITWTKTPPLSLRWSPSGAFLYSK